MDNRPFDDDEVGRWMVASAAHEIEAPLTRLRAALRCRSDADPDARLDEELGLVDRLTGVVRGLAALSSGERPAVESIDVHDAVELALQLTWREVATRACVTRRYRAIPHARAHHTTVARAIVVLLRNAAQSIPTVMPAANRIAVETGVGEDGRVLIDVVDTGVGITPDDLPHLFEPFFTTKGWRASGLGLAGARTAIELLGGTLTVESQVGFGSRFRITLPQDRASYASAFPGLRTQTIPLRRVLVVANATDQACRLAAMIDSQDTAITLADGEGALERLALDEPFEWVVWEAETWTYGNYRERLTQLAPDALHRTFAVSIPQPGAIIPSGAK